MPSKHAGAQDKHDTAMAPPKPRSRISQARGRQVQSGRGSTGHDRSTQDRSRR